MRLRETPSRLVLLSVLLITCADPGAAGGERPRPAGLDPGIEITAPARQAAHVALSVPEVLALRSYREVPAIDQAVARFLAEEPAACVEALAPWQAAHPETLGAAYLLGVCEHFAGQHEEALARLEKLRAADPLLAEYAAYFAAASAHALGRGDEVARLVAFVPGDSPQRERALRLLVESLGETAPARVLPALEDFLAAASAKTDLRWRQAELLAQTGRHDAAIAALWALWAELPLSAEAERVPDEVARLASALPAGPREAATRPTPAHQRERARRLYAAHQSERAIAAWGEIAAGSPEGSAAWCEARHMMARSYDKLRQRAKSTPHYDAVLAKCPHDPARVDMLFFGGKSAHQEGLRDRALRLFASLHREFPEHSYNDDALLREADVHRDEGRPEKARAALARALREYPEGDMREEAAWGLQWAAWSEERYTEAISQAEENLSLLGQEQSFRSRGRTLYWKARAHQKLGQEGAAAEAFRLCMASYPLSWYAGLAYSRLHERDPKQARRVLAALRAADTPPPSPLDSPEKLAFTTAPAFQRGVEFLRLGLHAPAGWELGALRTDTASPAADWLLAALWDGVGVYPRSHNIARRQRPEYADHFPEGPQRRLWQLAYPRPYRTLVAEAARETELPEALLHAIMREESGFDPGIESWANAIGLLQLLVPTAQDQATPEDGTVNARRLREPKLNIRLGSRFLGNLYHGFGEHPSLAAAGYNAGMGRLRRWMKERGDLDLDEFVERIPFSQTRGYTKRVTESYLRYEYLYGARSGELPVLKLRLR